MKIILKLFWIVILFVSFSCVKKYKEMELVSITQIECDTVLVDDKLIDVNGICVSDDMVIFAHEKAEPLIQIFDRMNNKYIGGIGEKGKGANSGSIRTPIPETSGRPFWNDPDTRSGNIRTVIPETSGH